MKNLKKILILLLALTTLAFVLASCGEEEYVPEGDGFFPPEEEEDEVKDHVCIANGNVFENIVESTCTVAGSYDDVYYCAICNAEVVRTTKPSELKPHDYVDGFCSVCNVKKSSEGLDFSYSASFGGRYILTGIGECTDENIVIPATYNGLPVLQIASNAFEGNTNIKSVEIPDSITTIFEWAFKDCTNLESVSFPSTLRLIYDAAFMGCTSLKNIVLPASVEIVGEAAFKGCTALESVTHNGIGEIRMYAFKDCTALSDITFTGSFGSIGMYTFENCVSLENITLPDGLKYLQGDLFAGCSNLKSVTIPASMYEIDSSAFETCEKMEVFYYKGTDWDSVWKTNVKALAHIRVEYIDQGTVKLPTIPA